MLTPQQQKANRFVIAHKDMDDALRYLDAYNDIMILQKKTSGSRYFDHCEAILIAAIISYCRSFKRSNSAENADSKINLEDFSCVTTNNGFSNLHALLMERRDKAIAHTDWEFHNTELLTTLSSTGEVLRRNSVAKLVQGVDIELFLDLVKSVKQTCIFSAYNIDSNAML